MYIKLINIKIRNLKFNNTIILFATAFLLSCFGLAQSGLPQFDVNKQKFDFGNTLLFQTKNDSIVFKNSGDTLLVIHSIDDINPPFFAKFRFPDTLYVGEQVGYPLIYRPFKSGKDSQRVFISTDTRLSNSIALLIDRSESMNYDMPGERVKKINATISAVKKFINSMVLTPTIFDEAGVFSFARIFYINQDFTTDKVKLSNALPSSLLRYTALFDGCVETINRLKSRPFNRVLIVLSDGDDNASSNTENDVITQARTNKIKVYTISIGGNNNDDAVLKRIASGTGGLFFEANTQKDLEDIYYNIFRMLSYNVQTYFDVVGACPDPILNMDCESDSLRNHYPGDTVIYKVNLKNIYSDGALNRDYELIFRFNNTLLVPINEDFEYLDDGSVSIKGTINTNLDSTYLKILKFLTLVGNDQCTDIYFEKIKWDDNYYSEIESGDVCGLCVNLCARNLRQVMMLDKNSLEQSYPNPATGAASIKFNIGNRGYHNLVLLDASGNKIADILYKILDSGEYRVDVDISRLSSGLYFYLLKSDTQILIKSMIINN